MKILVIFTGGTIGSSTEGKYTAPDKKNNYVLLDNYENKYGKDVSFDTASPFSMLSENLSHKELNSMIETIYNNLDKGYDGIILTHGTDSLQYTAAALSYCLPSAEIPIVLVSSRYPLSHPEENGNDNFAAAVAFIKEKSKGGVYIAYKNAGEEATHIHFGTRAFSHLEITDSLYSIDEQPYAFYKNEKIEINSGYKTADVYSENTRYEFCSDSGVLVVSSVPGDKFSYDLKGKKAVLLRPYHSGTVNTSSAEFRAFCFKAKELSIPVFIPRAGIETSYASTELFDELSIKYLPCMTFVASYIKLWLAVSCGADINEFMYKLKADEFIV